ncbi:MAG: TonB-dependent receptor [Saprospiraceae bacterium]|nr:TonB-dependent receptor [Saprospiraceae bacterium]
MKNACLFVILFFYVSVLSGQYSISGKLTNESGEQLIAASVFIPDSNYAGITDDRGNFKLEGIPAGNYKLKCSYVGYEDLIVDIILNDNLTMDLSMKGTYYKLDEIQLIANRLESSSPFSYSDMNKEEIEEAHSVQDVPYLFRMMPSVVVTSDAGAGVGYTGMRVRGSDATRINVTINGVPLNDSESHGVFWVDLPDFASSVENIQLQRGVGPSTNGAGAFGASIGLNTGQIYQNSFVEINTSYGSFDTKKFGVSMNTGLINDVFQIEGRYSLIQSDGYIDRASSDLNSWYFSAARVNEKSSLRLNVFSGKERTYQSWWGTPEALLSDEISLTDHYYNNLGVIYQTEADSVNLFTSGRTYNYYTYENQVDDYRQTHYQLLHALQLTPSLVLNTTLHYTKGKGFFEEYRVLDNLRDYGLDFEPVNTDLVRRRWLDNDFFGLIINSQYEFNPDLSIVVGGSFNRYIGDHFGQVIWADDIVITEPERYYYDNTGNKNDLNLYTKTEWALNDKIILFGDVQFRKIKYTVDGIDNDLIPVSVDTSYTFINPKAGLTYRFDKNRQLFFSYAKGEREPVRSDFIDAIGSSIPKSETLHDFEAGFKSVHSSMTLAVDAYYMLYKNQLVVTGAVNDVGAPVRTNVDNSYRAGVEFSLAHQASEKFDYSLITSLSHNRIREFDERIIDYGSYETTINKFEDTPIAFSPSIVASSDLSYNLTKGFTATLQSKFVGRQYLDNTGNKDRSLDPYLVNDIVFRYKINPRIIDNIEFSLRLNNVLDQKYSANGYTYSYIFGSLITENFHYPQAGFNFLLGLDIKF